ncbi:hypothetical protein U9M48_010755 [Paspalum notatum var. saurae]|uniref:Uncharacterized protein n=1 Tax=Paspalum notatum var. saurae TaxID=547442 RepID=A0AAQ3WGL0_PASNO
MHPDCSQNFQPICKPPTLHLCETLRIPYRIQHPVQELNELTVFMSNLGALLQLDRSPAAGRGPWSPASPLKKLSSRVPRWPPERRPVVADWILPSKRRDAMFAEEKRSEEVALIPSST